MRKGQNIHKRGDGRWEARYYIESEQKYKSLYARSYTEVKEKLTEALKNKKSNIPSTGKKISVNGAFDKFFSDINGIVKKSTYSTYYTTFTNHIMLDELGYKKICELQQADIDRFINKKLVCGKLNKSGGLSPKTCKDIASLLNLCLKSYGLIFEYTIPLPQENIKILSNIEFNVLLNYLTIGITEIKLGILLALLCGLRIGEICALKWHDIDFENKTLQINKTLQRIKNIDGQSRHKTIIIIDKPKTDTSIRLIPIQKALLNKMLELKTYEDFYILSNSKNYIEPRLLEKKFKEILKICHIKDINFHALRHTFATKAVEKEIDIKSLSEILGHSNVNFTMNRYVHSTIEQKRNQLEKFSF